MKEKKRRRVTTPDSVDVRQLELVLISQGNAIPEALAIILRMAAPLLARIAVRYVSRRLKRTVAESTVRAAGENVGSIVERIIERAKT